jgi:hypothetical protein
MEVCVFEPIESGEERVKNGFYLESVQVLARFRASVPVHVHVHMYTYT